MTSQHVFEDSPGLEGPDYVALIIEWDELADQIEDQIDPVQSDRTERIATASPAGALAALAAAAVGVLALMRWGLHRLRAA